jgi:hypothetical protein
MAAVAWLSVCLSRPQKIAAAFNGRYDRHQVRDRYHGQMALQAQRKLGRWSEDEDGRLRQVRACACVCVWRALDNPG